MTADSVVLGFDPLAESKLIEFTERSTLVKQSAAVIAGGPCVASIGPVKNEQSFEECMPEAQF